MLTNLFIKNLALIESAELDFNEGFNVLTGETGAGKSILINSLMMIIRDKSSKSLIRNDKDYALVEATFQLNNEDVKFIRELDIEIDDNKLIISKKLTKNRSILRINDRQVTMGLLRKISSRLVDICSQRENQDLIKRERQMELIDAYGNKEIENIKKDYIEQYKKYDNIKNELNKLKTSENDRQRRLDFLQYELEQIRNARLCSEDEGIEEEYQLVNNSYEIKEGMEEILSYIDRFDLAGIYKNINSLSNFCIKKLDDIREGMDNIEGLVNDLRSDISSYIYDLSFDPDYHQEIEDRYNLINSLKKRYGNTVKEILDYYNKINKEYEDLSNYDSLLHKKEELFKQEKQNLNKQALKLSKIRMDKGKALCEELKEVLKELSFNYIEIDVENRKLNRYSDNGIDDIGIIISLNKGEPMKPLEEVASGGELSRIMLALKAIISYDKVDTLIFDEIDTGIGGNTANSVARLIMKISQEKQVIAITHLENIAAAASTHFLISKESDEVNTRTYVRLLNNEETIDELARMSGNQSEVSRQNAKELKELYKSQFLT